MRRLSNLLFALFAVVTLAMLPQSAEARSKTAILGAMGDANGASECPAGQQLVGFSGRVGLWVDRVQIVCASPLAGGHFSQPIAQGPEFGGTGGGRVDGFCPRDTMLTGTTVALTRDDRQVAWIDMRCVSRASGEPNFASFGNLNYKASCKSVGVLSGADCPLRQSSDLSCPSDEVPTGINVRYGQHVNAIGLICARVAAPVAGQVLNSSPASTPAPKEIKRTGRPRAAPGVLVPVVAFGGKWQTVTDSGGHFELILQPVGAGIGPMGAPVQMPVSGSFTNTDGAHDYDGTLSGIVQPGTRQLVYGLGQKNGKGGQGTFTLSNDGRSLTGEGVVGGTHFTWNGQRAP